MHHYHPDTSTDVIRATLITYPVVHECCPSEGDDGKTGALVLSNGGTPFDEMRAKTYPGDWVGSVGC